MAARTLIRGSRDKKRLKQGLIFILLLLTILVAIIVFSTKYFQDKYQQLIQDQIQQLIKTSTPQKSNLTLKKIETKQGKIILANYIPSTESPAHPDAIEKRLMNLEINWEKTHASDDPTVFIGQVKIEDMTKMITRVSVSADAYMWDGRDHFVLKQNLTDSGVLYHKDTRKEITAQDFVTSDEDRLGIQHVIMKKILDEDQGKTSGLIDAVLDMPRIDGKTQMTYSFDQLTVHLPENSTGRKSIDLKYSEITPFINRDLIDPSQLKEMPAIDPNKKYVALTFDDGPKRETTPKLLDILNAKKVHATFFILGQHVANNGDILKRIRQDGHEIENHTFTHRELTKLSEGDVQDEVRRSDKAIFEASGVLPKSLRPPYGAINSLSARVYGKPVIQWNVDSVDWKSRNTAAVIKQVTSNAVGGGIILMHDIHSTSVDAVPAIIDQLRGKGFEFVTVDQLLSGSDKPLHQYFSQADERKVE